MQRRLSLLLALCFLGLALAGCSQARLASVEAAFTVTALDEARSRFRFEASTTPAKEGLVYTWDFGDRSPTVEGRMVEHAYEYPGAVYKVSMVVASPTEREALLPIEESVMTGDGTNEAPLLYLTLDRRLAKVGEPVLFDASQSHDPDGDPIFFEWDFNAPIDHANMGSFENLGNQQYGRYAANKPPPAASAEPQGGDGGSPTPSGHEWAAEVEAAKARMLSRAGIERLDAGHGGGGPHEERNLDIDGKVPDDGPIQFFAYPAAATYYAYVRVSDIKGAYDEGFIRLLVAATVPSASNTTNQSGTLQPPAIGENVGPVESDFSDRAMFPFRYEHPGTSVLNLTFAVEPQVGEEKVGVWVCGNSTPYAECRSTNKAGLAEGQSGRNLVWVVGPGEEFPYTYNVWVGNRGNAIVEYEIVVDTRFDLNPWAKEEAGLASGG